ncbi:MAG: hypothetical protein Q9162_004968 [Coniocarpon cinnabarinum]
MAPPQKSKFVEDFSDSESESESQETSEAPPTSIDPYEVLNVSSDASQDDIKHSYRKLALLHHPDKVSDADKTTAKEAFQRIAFAYAILSDPQRRSRYDATGSTSDSILDDEGDGLDWLSFYRSQFENVITEERINAFKSEYKSGNDERADIIKAYKKSKGNMDKVYESVMLSNVLDDDERFRSIIDEAIENKEVEAFDKYTKETEKSKAARLRHAKGEEKEAKEEKQRLDKERKQKGKGKKYADEDLGDLAAMIQSNQQKRGGFMAQLEAKYGGSKRKRGATDEPSEESFAVNRAKGKKAKA